MFNANILATPIKALGKGITTVAKGTDAGFILLDGLSVRAKLHSDAKIRLAEQSHERDKKVADSEHNAQLLERLAAAKNRMTKAKALGLGATVNQNIGDMLETKAKALTEEQLIKLATSGKDVTDPEVLRKELLSNDSPTNATEPSSDILADLMASNSNPSE